MKKNSFADYLGFILFKLASPIIRRLPHGLVLFCGRRLGELIFYFDARHRSQAYVNIKTALGRDLSPEQVCRLTRDFYRSLGQDVVEIFFVPLVDREYIARYITIEGRENIDEAFRRGKGVILLGSHEGSWEITNVILANLGFPLYLFIRDQKYSRLNGLLNHYRSARGCRLIQRKNRMRQLIEVLRNNYAVGMTLDQGGRAGVLVKFFGKPASMAAAAVRLALKYDTAIIPGFSWRQKGARLKLVFGQPFNIKKTKDSQKDIRDNLQELSRILEKNVSRHPQEYLWSHKIWKYSDEKNILILSDGKTGHLRQAQQVASLVYRSLKEKDIKGSIDTVEVSYRGPISKFMMKFGSCLSSRFSCQGCLWCLRSFLEKESYLSLIRQNPDIIISCGSAVAPVNLVLSRESLAKSIVIMRPSILSTRRFDLVILPRHDNPRQSGNIIVTEGALNLIDDQYLQEQSQRLLGRSQSRILDSGLYLGLLVGGDTKDFHLEQETVSKVIQQIRLAADDLDAQILATTSRRTPKVIEELLKEALKDNPRCRLLVIANEKNIPEAVGGILGLSSIVITTPESMSMVSEAVSSKKYVLVFDAKGIRGKRRRFLRHFARNNYINLVEPDNLCRQIKELWRKKPARGLLRDNLLVSESIRKKIA